MTKKSDTFKDNHLIQLNWIKNQITKGNEGKIFLNPKKAVEAFEILDRDLVLNPDSVEKFVSRFLSEKGMNSLLNTLRVANSRSKVEVQLQVRLERAASQKLNSLVKSSGLTKVEVINKMILDAESSNYKGAVI